MSVADYEDRESWSRVFFSKTEARFYLLLIALALGSGSFVGQ